jgi:hypothetical protein
MQLRSPGTLVAKGAGVDVSVTASCSGLNVESGTASIGLTEAVKKGVANGFGGATIDCTGTTQTVEVLVIADAPAHQSSPNRPSRSASKPIGQARLVSPRHSARRLGTRLCCDLLHGLP